MRKFRYIEYGHGEDSLTEHERQTFEVDFDIDIAGYHVLVALTAAEWRIVSKDSNTYCRCMNSVPTPTGHCMSCGLLQG